jgi:hypothetical protein
VFTSARFAETWGVQSRHWLVWESCQKQNLPGNSDGRVSIVGKAQLERLQYLFFCAFAAPKARHT